MSTSTRSIALAGAGGIGTHILRALVNSPNHPKVIVLTRAESKALPSEFSSVPTVTVDYTDVSALTSVFKEHSIDVVLSTLGSPGIKAQYTLADAAKASGTVKLFVPSEWGIPTAGAKAKGEDNGFARKDEFAEYLKSIQFPYTRFYTGFFLSGLSYIAGIDTNDKVNILGKGETPLSVTSESDIGGFTAHVLTSLPLDSPDLVNKSMLLEGHRITFRELARIFDKPIAFVPEGDLVPGKTDGERQFKTLLQTQAEAGRVSSGWNRATDKDEFEAGSTNKLWEGHVWDKVEKPAN